MPRPRNVSSVGVSHCSRRAHSISDGARFGEALGHFLAQPARSAGDDGDAAGEIEQVLQRPHHLLWASMNFTSVAV